MFRKVPLSIVRSFSLYTQQWYMSYSFADSLRAGSGYSILILLASCLQICMTHTIAECTVKNSWRWTEKLSETWRVLFQNKFEKLVHLVGFIIRKGSLLSYFRRPCIFQFHLKDGYGILIFTYGNQLKNCRLQEKNYFGYDTCEITAVFTILIFLVLRVKSVNSLW
jgi:hypothetical protein